MYGGVVFCCVRWGRKSVISMRRRCSFTSFFIAPADVIFSGPRPLKLPRHLCSQVPRHPRRRPPAKIVTQPIFPPHHQKNITNIVAGILVRRAGVSPPPLTTLLPNHHIAQTHPRDTTTATNQHNGYRRRSLDNGAATTQQSRHHLLRHRL